jgi:hypothetical protein
MPIYFLFPSKRFCKVSNDASNATKFVQIDEGMSKICLLQVKGVMGMMWVGTCFDKRNFLSFTIINKMLWSLLAKHDF